MDIWKLYEMMLKSRLFEESVTNFWNNGHISGEMHLGIGEEAIVAGIVDNLEDGDAMALDHRSTPPMVMRGINLLSLMKEFLGSEEGLCGGKGGHMHLFSKGQLIASSGIIGSSGPAAAGFALSSQYRKEGKIAIAFFGEGTMNQGMMLESMNLTVAWNLPVIFVCKDNKMAITTVSSSVTGGNLVDRAIAFGMPGYEIDGSNVESVWKIAQKAISDARKSKGPSYIHAHCFRREGHFLGDPLIRISRHPYQEMSNIAGPLMKSATKFKGSSIAKRAKSMKTVLSILGKAAKDQMLSPGDPIEMTRKKLKKEPQRLEIVEKKVKSEIEWVEEECMKRSKIEEVQI